MKHRPPLGSLLPGDRFRLLEPHASWNGGGGLVVAVNKHDVSWKIVMTVMWDDGMLNTHNWGLWEGMVEVTRWRQ